MIILSVGLPSSFATWCDTLTLHLAQRSLGPVKLIAANTLEELALGALRASSPNIIVAARHPGARLRQALIDIDARFLVSLGEWRTAVANTARAPGCSLSEAVRSVASSCTSILRFAELPGALRLVAGSDESESVAMAGAICHHLGFVLEPPDIAEIVEELRASKPEAQDVDAWWAGLGKDDRAQVTGALEYSSEYAATGRLGQITWERGLFLSGDNSDAPVGVLDITGRSRYLIYGPYIMLPPGSWTAHVIVACSKEVAGVPFIIDVICGPRQFAHTRLQPERGGVYEVSLDFVIEDLTEVGIEVRIFLERAAFDGGLGLGRVILTPRTRVSEDARDVALELGLEID